MIESFLGAFLTAALLCALFCALAWAVFPWFRSGERKEGKNLTHVVSNVDR